MVGNLHRSDQVFLKCSVTTRYLYGIHTQKNMAYAIIETGGKQMRVEPGRFYDVERLIGDPETPVTIDKVFFVSEDDNVTIGQPLVAGATVQGKILKQFRAKKVIVYKMQPKKKTRKKRGHRQEQTRFLVESITIGGKTFTVG
jgi:large subunit ribosomal protein L21